MTTVELETFIAEQRALLAIAEACHRRERPDHAMHVVDWLAFKLRCKYLDPRSACPVCNGRGVYDSADMKTGQHWEFECYRCNGKGVVLQ